MLPALYHPSTLLTLLTTLPLCLPTLLVVLDSPFMTYQPTLPLFSIFLLILPTLYHPPDAAISCLPSSAFPFVLVVLDSPFMTVVFIVVISYFPSYPSRPLSPSRCIYTSPAVLYFPFRDSPVHIRCFLHVFFPSHLSFPALYTVSTLLVVYSTFSSYATPVYISLFSVLSLSPPCPLPLFYWAHFASCPVLFFLLRYSLHLCCFLPPFLPSFLLCRLFCLLPLSSLQFTFRYFLSSFLPTVLPLLSSSSFVTLVYIPLFFYLPSFLPTVLPVLPSSSFVTPVSISFSSVFLPFYCFPFCPFPFTTLEFPSPPFSISSLSLLVLRCRHYHLQEETSSPLPPSHSAYFACRSVIFLLRHSSLHRRYVLSSFFPSMLASRRQHHRLRGEDKFTL